MKLMEVQINIHELRLPSDQKGRKKVKLIQLFVLLICLLAVHVCACLSAPYAF